MDGIVRCYVCDDAGVVHIHLQDDSATRSLRTPRQMTGRFCASFQSDVLLTESTGPAVSFLPEPARASTLCSRCVHVNRQQTRISTADNLATTLHEDGIPSAAMAQPPSPSSTAAVAGPSRAMTETAHAAASNSHPLHDNGVSEAERKRRRRQNYKKLDKTQEGVYERSAKRDQYNNHQSPPFRRLNQVYEVLANVVAPATEFAGAAVNSDTGGTQRDPWQQRFGEPVWTQPPVPSDLKKAVIKSMSKGKGKGKEDDSSA